MKRTLLLFSICISLVKLDAQVETYDLSKYVQGPVNIVQNSMTPSARFSSQDVSFDSSNTQYQLGYGSFSHSYIRTKVDTYNYNFINLRSNLSASLSRNNERKQLEFSPRLGLDYRKNHYFKGNQFIGLDLDSDNRYGHYHYYSSTNQDAYNNPRLSVSQDVQWSYGLGRAQLIEDPLKAIAILRLLENDGFLVVDNISHDDINQLSTVLNSLRSLRNESTDYTDSRLLQNAQFSALASHLIDKGLVREDDYAMYALVYDAWRYENFFNRKTNNEFRIGAEYAYEYFWGLYFDTEEERRTIYRIPGVFVSYEVNKPLGVNWFLTGNNKVSAFKLYKEEPDFQDSISVENQNGIRALTEWQLGFQPNLRTTFTLDFKFQKFWGESSRQSEPYIDTNALEWNIFSGMTYYFSPQYRLFVSIGMEKDHREESGFLLESFSSYMYLSVNYLFR